MKGLHLAVAAAAVLAASALHAGDDGPAGFSWRADLDTGNQAGLVRVDVPADALARLQSRTAADLRVFDAQGRPVPFALSTPPRPTLLAREESTALRALPLYAAAEGTTPPQGSVQLNIDDNGTRRSLWVQMGAAAGGTPASSTALPAALFDTRSLRQPITGLSIRADLPANVPVQFTLATSRDLAHWEHVPVQGRVYRFDGAAAPANDILELGAPLQLQDRYLRLDWSGQQGVRVTAAVGLLAAREPPRRRPAIPLTAASSDGDAALAWPLGFATPITRLELSTSQPNTLLPVRVLGRNQPSESWRVLTQTVVYRLGAPGHESISAAVDLPPASVRWLRVEATHGARLGAVPLTARVLFEPLEVVFVAGAPGPYRLVAGRSNTASAALPLAMLAATTSAPIDALPFVRITSVQSETPAPPGWWTPLLPQGVDDRTAGLWLVLALAVLVLGGVAWSLVQQLNARRE